jgi:hypothetical protein
MIDSKHVHILFLLFIVQLFWIASWGTISHLVQWLTRGNIAKEIGVYFVMFIIVLMVYMTNPDLIEHV